MTIEVVRDSASFACNQSQVVRCLFPLNLVIFLGFMTVSLPLAVLPLFASTTFGAGSLMIGLLVGLQSLSTVVSRPFAGRFTDTRGSRSAAILGLWICVATGGVYLTSCFVPFGLAILLAGRVALGLGESLILTGAITWGISRVGLKFSGQVMSWNGIAMYGALAAGAPLGLLVYQAFGGDFVGFEAVGVVTSLLPFAAFLVACSIPPVPLQSGPRVETGPILRKIWPFGLSLTLLMASYGVLSSFYSLMFEHARWAGSGWGFLGFGVAVVAVRLLFGKAPDIVGGEKVAFYSMVCAGIGQGTILLANTSNLAIAGATLTGAGVALGFPALGIEAMKHVPASSRGMMVAIFSAFQDLAFGASGPLAGLIALATNTGPRAAFVLGCVAPFLAISMLWTATRRSR